MAEKKKKTGKPVKFKKLASPIVTVALFVAAAAMLLGSTIGGTRAALQFYSANYLSNVSLKYIGVSLMESNSETEESDSYQRVAWRNYDANGVWDKTDIDPIEEGVGTLLKNLLGTGESRDKAFKIGKSYTEKLAVANTGTIDTYVRVIVTKYWVKPQKDQNGRVIMEKATQLDPGMIDLHWINTEGDGAVWLIDEEASTPERTVLYYKGILEAMKDENGQQKISMTEPLCDTLTVNGEINVKVTQTESKGTKDDGREYTTITTTYDYDGTEFVVKAEVDAVQTHSAEAAIWSAWGRRVSVNDETKELSLTVDRTADAAPEPETTESPEATSEPETTESPEATAGPEATESPEATAEPEATQLPDETPEPEATAEPETPAGE